MFFKNNNICPYCEEIINGNVACSNCSKVLKMLINKHIGKTKDCNFFTAAFLYKDIVRDAILNFKFKQNTSFCYSFCSFMATSITNNFDILVCVPTFDEKFNPSKEIAKKLKKKLKIKFCKDAVVKIKKTKHQHNCKLSERVINLKNAFRADNKKLKNKTVLICDDVITTSSTIQEMSYACKQAGAKYVCAIAFAISEKLYNKNI